MLKQFTFKNYKCFRDENTLSMVPSKKREYSNHLIQYKNEKILPVAAIFGANASGKSKLIEALRYMQSAVLLSFNWGGDLNEFFKPTPFLFDNYRNKNSYFEVFILDRKDLKTYQYGFTINKNGFDEEWLLCKTRSGKKFIPIFERKKNDIEFYGIQETFKKNIELSLQKESLIVSLGSKLNIDVFTKIRNWFYNLEFVDFGEPFENYILSKQMPNNFTDKKTQKEVVNFLASFDDSIIDFDVETINDEKKNRKKYKIKSIHKTYDNSNSKTTLNLFEESAGTLKMFAMYPHILEVLSKGGILIIDELNARLHPLLVRYILLLFLNPEKNKNKAQIIFTTHDTWQLKEAGLRRDEIWFTEKNKKEISSLYSLIDVVDIKGNKIRNDEDFAKNYLLGKYGAIPELKYTK